ncbi:L-aspartate oxidase [Glutamicibacter protophormiae]|uniref:L-aspartate oxidase n=1 Tax=Glutamicibacter protophormiae TaxID=37930 RepID=A0ABS4XS11_GLUPR|nr:FAD-binding protein [Glutamicibacter protophormiae]MBP2399294.1 L-aspartate oxidase [Glutamicibacter protophormiae]GGM00858.1 L-aspartate oxidase [Glutamicibacter protophormiae]
MKRLIIIGSGVAGLTAALQAAAAGAHPVLLTKDRLGDSNSELAQGGLSAVTAQSIAAGDSVAAHVADTLAAGAGHCGPQAVRYMCASAADLVEQLEAHAVGFDRTEGGGYQLGLEAAHSAHRILHIHGDATGAGLVAALSAAVRRARDAGKLTVREHALAASLVLDERGAVAGVQVLQDGRAQRLAADAVLLATGGLGRLYAATTNPAGATADGIGLAARAGAVIADAEFVQFHPTLVDPARYPAAGMVSEAVRGEGAVLVTDAGERFMPAEHPEAELAPRDVVARGIHRQLLAGRTVYLDARGIEAERGAGFLARRFPSITARLASCGLDLAADLVPVVPAQHYAMGGIAADASARTTVPGLYAAGECANTTVHGANRLASNSLLEAMVFARTAVQAMLSDDPGVCADLDGLDGMTVAQLPTALSALGAAEAPLDLETLQREASEAIGVYRTGKQLERFAGLLAACAPVAESPREQLELENLWLTARFTAAGALARTGSLGAHHRLDAAPGQSQPAIRYGWRLSAAERTAEQLSSTTTSSSPSSKEHSA